MEAWFPSKRRRPVAIDHEALLARTAALQAATPTARAQSRVEFGGHIEDDSHVAVFADATEQQGVAAPASFADVEPGIFRPRQSS